MAQLRHGGWGGVQAGLGVACCGDFSRVVAPVFVKRYCSEHATGVAVGEPLGTALYGTNLTGSFEIR